MTEGLYAGLILGSRYKLIESVGAGGFSVVYRARDLNVDRVVAVKILHEHLAGDPSLVQRFHREVVKAGKLTHESIVFFLDQGEDQGLHYLVMEFLEGQTLALFLSLIHI